MGKWHWLFILPHLMFTGYGPLGVGVTTAGVFEYMESSSSGRGSVFWRESKVQAVVSGIQGNVGSTNTSLLCGIVLYFFSFKGFPLSILYVPMIISQWSWGFLNLCLETWLLTKIYNSLYIKSGPSVNIFQLTKGHLSRGRWWVSCSSPWVLWFPLLSTQLWAIPHGGRPW